MSFYFYLSLLINNTANNTNILIHYIYSIENIKDMINYQKSINQNYKIKKLIISKIIIEIIQNYKSSNKYDEKNEEEELNKIINENNNTIQKNISSLNNIIKNCNENYLVNEKIDQIYIDIIFSLFKEKNFSDIKNILLIFHQLELESINLTERMIDELYKFFDLNNELVQEFIIKDIKDLFNIKIINFYYLIFKYLFKRSFFVYQFPFLIR